MEKRVSRMWLWSGGFYGTCMRKGGLHRCRGTWCNGGRGVGKVGRRAVVVIFVGGGAGRHWAGKGGLGTIMEGSTGGCW
jgi:hypothetical protein